MAANKPSATVKVLQLPEGYTVRKVKGILKVVVAKPREAAIVKKAMLKGIRKNFKSGEFDYQMSARETIWTSKCRFTVDELVSTLEGLLDEAEDGRFTRRQIARLLSGWESMYDNIIQINDDTYEYRAS